MKDQCLFELVLARLLGCHSEALSDRDQREAILTEVSKLLLLTDSPSRNGSETPQTSATSDRSSPCAARPGQ